jgi:hypothetical protein
VEREDSETDVCVDSVGMPTYRDSRGMGLPMKQIFGKGAVRIVYETDVL